MRRYKFVCFDNLCIYHSSPLHPHDRITKTNYFYEIIIKFVVSLSEKKVNEYGDGFVIFLTLFNVPRLVNF